MHGHICKQHRQSAIQYHIAECYLQPRGGASLVAHKQKLFLIGGFSGGELGDVHVYDLTNSQGWVAVSGGNSLPPRSVFACGLLF